jgi:hypothetical protein
MGGSFLTERFDEGVKVGRGDEATPIDTDGPQPIFIDELVD